MCVALLEDVFLLCDDDQADARSRNIFKTSRLSCGLKVSSPSETLNFWLTHLRTFAAS
jgi:hypothetical protein